MLRDFWEYLVYRVGYVFLLGWPAIFIYLLTTLHQINFTLILASATFFFFITFGVFVLWKFFSLILTLVKDDFKDWIDERQFKMSKMNEKRD